MGAASATAYAATNTGTTTQGWAKGRVLVMPRAGLSDSELGKIVGPLGGKARQISKSRIYIVDLPAGASETAVVEQLAHNPHLKFAELDRQVAPSLSVNDPYYPNEWHLAKIGASTAWNSTLGSGSTIAVLDTGVDGTHPDLSAQMVPGWNFYDNNSNTSDVNGHGTWVAGAGAATTNDGLGVASVAGQSKIMPLRIAAPDGTGYWSMIAQAITYAADHGVRVANISYENLLSSSSIVSAAQYMKDHNGLVVVAAGNCGCNANLTPTTTMIPVSATDSNDLITSFSSYGSYVAMSAPGNYIYTTAVGGGYTQGIGTSFASPIVAATVSLMMSANPKLSNTQVESLLYSTATDLGAAGRDIYYGYGRVNAAAAVQAAVGSTTTADTQPPTVSISAPLASATVSGLVSVDVSATDNVGVAKVNLLINGSILATDTASPYAFSWDSTKVANGSATITAVAYDAAGNSTASTPVTVNVSNVVAPTVADTTPPAVTILSPAAGTTVSGRVTVSTSATDNSGSAGISQALYIDGSLKATATGGSLSYSWNTRKASSGSHTIQAVAKDASGNTSSTSVQVSK
ncbi:MAG: S8 family serine peptidase [Deltaproteobacteria bacterium]